MINVMTQFIQICSVRKLSNRGKGEVYVIPRILPPSIVLLILNFLKMKKMTSLRLKEAFAVFIIPSQLRFEGNIIS